MLKSKRHNYYAEKIGEPGDKDEVSHYGAGGVAGVSPLPE
jgi:hypothetical protein